MKTTFFFEFLLKNFQIILSFIFKVRGRGLKPVKVKRFISSPNRPDRLWDTTCLLFNRYRGSFTGGKAAGT
jgi:hypothetical protein